MSVLLAVLFSACGEQSWEWAPELDESSAPSPPVLAQLVASQRQPVPEWEGQPEARQQLSNFSYLSFGLYDRATRVATVDSFLTVWESQPAHPLWVEVWNRRQSILGESERIDKILASPTLVDTSSAMGAFVQGWTRNVMSNRRGCFARAYERSDELDDLSRIWIAKKYAYTLRRTNEPERGLALMLEYLPEARRVGGPTLESFLWSEIVRACQAMAELDDALHAVMMSERLRSLVARESHERRELLHILRDRATILADRGDFAEALDLYRSNIETALEFDFRLEAATNLNRAATIAEVTGDRETGLQFCMRGLELSLSDKDSMNVPRHMSNISRRFLMMGELDSAQTYLETAAEWVDAFPNRENRSRFPLMQAEFYAAIGAYDAVDSLLQTAMSLSSHDDTNLARAELYLEAIRGWMEAGRPERVYRSIEAIAEFRDGVADYHPDRNVAADINLLIGEFLTKRSEFAKADDALDMAAAALQRRPIPAKEWVLARNRGQLARARGSLSHARKEFERCVELGVQLEIPAKELEGRLLLGAVHLDRGEFAAARDLFHDVDAEHFQTKVLASLLIGLSYAREGDAIRALEHLAEARGHCRSWSPRDLVARIELEQARALSLAGKQADADSMFDHVAKYLRELSATIETEELTFFNGDLRRDLVEARLSTNRLSPAEALEFARGVLPRWSNGENAADLRSMQVVFFVGRERTTRWLIGSETQLAELPGESELNRLLAPVLADLQNPARMPLASELQRVSEILLAGVESILGKQGSLSITPDLGLYRVPWAALTPEADGLAMIDRGPLQILERPATTTQVPIGTAHGSMLAIGADGEAALDGESLAVLTHAEEEARDVAQKWVSGRADVRTGSAASDALTDNPLLHEYSAIHLASHAKVLVGKDEETTILLPGSSNKPLPASAIREFNLDAELVFLSCCEAGDGGRSRSAFAGLAHAFAEAGAKNVVAPISIIDDAPARYLANQFYAEWQKDGVSVPEALRRAQRALRDGDGDWSHPFYWAFYQVF